MDDAYEEDLRKPLIGGGGSSDFQSTPLLDALSDARRIILLGKTGCGKSSLANTIFGKKEFRTGDYSNSETNRCEARTRSVNGRSVTLIDTPGFFDTNMPEEELKPEIVRCITVCAPGPHAFLIMFKVERFTEQEQAVITKITNCFSEEALKYAVVVFTHGDQLPEGKTIEDFFRGNEKLKDLVEKCGGRCHVVDNKYWNNNQQDDYRSNKIQVKKLLNTIEQIVKGNNGGCYTNEMLQEVEREIQQEKEKIRQLSGNLSAEEIREKAKESVFKNLWIKLAGITTGALLGALFGAITGGLNNLFRMAAVSSGVGAAVVGAAAGAVYGGVQGYRAAEGAETPLEAVKKVAEIVGNVAQSALQDVVKRKLNL